MSKKELPELSAAEGMGSLPTIVVETRAKSRGKFFREMSPQEYEMISDARRTISDWDAQTIDGYSSIPDEEINQDTLGFRVHNYGLKKWSQLFNDRQLLLMSSLSTNIRIACDEMSESGMDTDLAAAVTAYLGCFLSRVGRENNAFVTWNPSSPKAQGIFSQPKLSMVWDYAEVNPFGQSVGDLSGALDIVVSDILGSPHGIPASVSQRDASTNSGTDWDLCVTDPPYYQALDYAGISDFFYVWLKRAIGVAHPHHFSLPLTPKGRQAIVRSERKSEPERERYLNLMSSAFDQIHSSVVTGSSIGVVFAHSDPDAWATLIGALIKPILFRRLAGQLTQNLEQK